MRRGQCLHDARRGDRPLPPRRRCASRAVCHPARRGDRSSAPRCIRCHATPAPRQRRSPAQHQRDLEIAPQDVDADGPRIRAKLHAEFLDAADLAAIHADDDVARPQSVVPRGTAALDIDDDDGLGASAAFEIADLRADEFRDALAPRREPRAGRLDRDLRRLRLAVTEETQFDDVTDRRLFDSRP